MRNPHRNAEVIKAWDDGYVIQYKAVGDGYWVDILSGSPHWGGDGEYRIKPEPKPDVVKYIGVDDVGGGGNSERVFHSAHIVDHWHNTVKLTFDGESGKLKSAEVIS